MRREHSNLFQHDDYGERWEIAAALVDGPKTPAEVAEHLNSYLRFVGLFGLAARLGRPHDQRLAQFAERTLQEMLQTGWVEQQDARYALTALGRSEADRVLSELRESGANLAQFMQPQTVSQVSLVAHLLLAAVKLPAGLWSGSVGLINDATDTLLDGLSSLLVYAGLRYDRERLVNVLLVLIMLATGALTFYEAIRRLFTPSAPDADLFTFAAAIISALVCALLWLYQRFVGLRSGSMPLITQSVDSRNHVLVAASVTAGLVASRMRFPLLDTLVGLAVACLILRSALELAIETARAINEDQADLSRYAMPPAEWYNQFRQGQLGDWMLYMVDRANAKTKAELARQAQQALDFRSNPTLRALGLVSEAPGGQLVQQSLEQLLEGGFLVDDGQLQVTPAGQERVQRSMRPTRAERHGFAAQHERRSRKGRWHP